jgi:AAA+ ATPase superfamily predicted ATPase
MEFSGRDMDLGLLGNQLRSVADGTGATRGRAVIVTGRRRVGKSRLVQEFCDRSTLASVVFQATRRRHPAAERADFVTAVAEAGLPGSELVAGIHPEDWNQALRALAVALPDDQPTIAVIDEVPWLADADAEFEGALQTVWDRHLSAKPVLLLLVGSDQSVMAALQDYGRPFYGRAATLTVDPLNPADVQDMTGLPAAEAIDAWLITGGFPQIAGSWLQGEDRRAFLRRSVADPLSPLLVNGELTLLEEFPPGTRSRAILEAIGAGERTFSLIARAVGVDKAVPSGTLAPLLQALQAKHVVASELPLGTVSDAKNRRYRIADPYLRFWLAFGPRVVPLAERGRGDVALDLLERSWTSWRGRAVEPLVRASLERLLPNDAWPEVFAVGGWWNRQNNPEIDLVGADQAPVARRVACLGSIKWHDNQDFRRRDYEALVRAAAVLPDAADVPLVAVARSGVDKDLPLAATWGPDDLVNAWRS